MVTDSISDLLTRIRNGVKAKKREVNIPSSRLGVEVVKILKEEGYIKNFKVVDDDKQGILNVSLKYTEANQSVITGLRRVSTPGRRVYLGKTRLPKVMGGLGASILSTSRGLMTDREAREAGLGGELVCQVW